MLQVVPVLFAQTSQPDSMPIFPDLSHNAFIITALLGVILILALLYFWRRKSRLHPQADLNVSKQSAMSPSAILDMPSPSVASAPFLERPDEVAEILRDNTTTWLERLRQGLSKTRQNFKDNLSRLLGGDKTFDEGTLEQIHEVLYRSDLGVETADFLVASLRRRFLGGADSPSWPQISAALTEAVSETLTAEETPLHRPSEGPQVILVIGVNGVGKTTSIGKLSARFIAEGKSVLLAAADTYRAAAIEQLQVWGDRLGVPVIKHQQGADPASVAFDAVKAAKARQVDVLLIDTAGRLHNKQELMDELAKIKRVIGRELPGAPHETWLVIDATTGQNAVQQVKVFQELVQLTGLIVTKLDGTAKGGVIIGIKRRFQLPIRYIGIGEKAADLKEFSPFEFAASLFG